MERDKTCETQHEIICEAFKALKRFADDDVDLLSIIGSYGDTLDDSDVLSLLRDWNAGRRVLNQEQ